MAPARNNVVDDSPATTLTILGCGTLGSAILFGLLASSVENNPAKSPYKKGIPNGTNGHGHASSSSREEGKDSELQKPTHFIACVRTAESASRLQKELSSRFPHQVPVTVLHGENVRAVQSASTILLGCQPQDLTTCLSPPALTAALHGKLLISILAGVTIPQIESLLYNDHNHHPTKPNGTAPPKPTKNPTTIIRAMPNTASSIHLSTTILSSPPSTPLPHLTLTTHIFSPLGTVTSSPPSSNFDAYTALCGSTPAFFALILEALVDGSISLGLSKKEALRLAAETMRGCAELVLQGEGTECVREKVCTPGGSTIQGLLVLERGAVRGVVADALARAAGAAGGLGQ
ncbi:hypothetical protein JMJ35_010007 [Cladonia borealis]|uniref:Pyrroline-5-carboxylate reductase n=1 Tax=Cladonia borealis TaxID=184061 RepID=A0AA39QT89_9LECA|nr:hypothetical protein JMJ35_010007 [Cladonia borealis]